MDGTSERDLWLEQAMVQWEVPLLRSCYLILKDAALAEDAVQETFVKAWKAFGTRRKDTSEKCWLMRIALNTCRDMLRSSYFRHTDRRICTEDLPESSIPFREKDDTMLKAIISLPAVLRQVILLRYYQGFTVQETAQITGVSRRMVYNRLAKAERLLKCSLEEWYHAE